MAAELVSKWLDEDPETEEMFNLCINPDMVDYTPVKASLISNDSNIPITKNSIPETIDLSQHETTSIGNGSINAKVRKSIESEAMGPDRAVSRLTGNVSIYPSHLGTKSGRLNVKPTHDRQYLSLPSKNNLKTDKYLLERYLLEQSIPQDQYEPANKRRKTVPDAPALASTRNPFMGCIEGEAAPIMPKQTVDPLHALMPPPPPAKRPAAAPVAPMVPNGFSIQANKVVRTPVAVSQKRPQEKKRQSTTSPPRQQSHLFPHNMFGADMAYSQRDGLPPQWPGIHMLGATDTDLTNGVVNSPNHIIGLPFGGTIETTKFFRS